MRKTITIILIFTVAILSKTDCYAKSQVDSLLIEQQFNKAKNYLISFKNDSAYLILNKLIDQLDSKGELDSPLGIRIQFRQAEALEKDQKDVEALEKLVALKKLCFAKKQWDTYSFTCLMLARLYEKINKPDDCYLNLMAAKRTIESQQNIDSIYSRFAIRISSYHRLFKDRDSSTFYAKEALRTAPIHNQKPDEAVAHMLLGMVTDDTTKTAKLNHYLAAGILFKEIGDFAGLGFMTLSSAGWYLDNEELEKAMLYCDSSIMATKEAIRIGHEERWHLAYAYRFKGNVYRLMNNIDSSWHYVNKGYQTELSYTYQNNNEEVLKLDAKYKNEEKARRILEQEEEIEYRNSQKNILTGVLAVIFLLASLLYYNFIKLRRASNKMKQQSSLIENKNEELSTNLKQQIVLQSEVHHRVRNNLQVIISLLDLQKEDIEDANTKDSLEAMSSRIYSMAAIHEILYNQEDMSLVNLDDYVNNLCLHFSNFSLEENKPLFTVAVKNHFFNLQTCMPIGIMLTELLTNSLKYARVENQKLNINIKLTKQNERFCLTYKDNGPGFQGDKLTDREGGLGSYLLRSMSRQLNGHIETKNDDGACFEIYFEEKQNYH